MVETPRARANRLLDAYAQTLTNEVDRLLWESFLDQRPVPRILMGIAHQHIHVLIRRRAALIERCRCYLVESGFTSVDELLDI